MAMHYWTAKSELALTDTRYRRAILAWDSARAFLLVILRKGKLTQEKG